MKSSAPCSKLRVTKQLYSQNTFVFSSLLRTHTSQHNSTRRRTLSELIKLYAYDSCGFLYIHAHTCIGTDSKLKLDLVLPSSFFLSNTFKHDRCHTRVFHYTSRLINPITFIIMHSASHTFAGKISANVPHRTQINQRESLKFLLSIYLQREKRLAEPCS